MFHNATVIQHDCFGGGRVIVWGVITVNRKTDLVTVQGTPTGQK